ncbi:MAG: hypothetical protein LVS60_19035 [Nodosilinea sp. LVE1205-7]|jgi:cytosine/adenosine deaminase-related metal-dependent hydrolase
MALHNSADSKQLDHAHIWYSLKSAIANSSGFNSWKGELAPTELQDLSSDHLVRRYLRETLETLAY